MSEAPLGTYGLCGDCQHDNAAHTTVSGCTTTTDYARKKQCVCTAGKKDSA